MPSMKHDVSTRFVTLLRRCFNVVTASKQRCIDANTTPCAYWVIVFFKTAVTVSRFENELGRCVDFTINSWFNFLYTLQSYNVLRQIYYYLFIVLFVSFFICLCVCVLTMFDPFFRTFYMIIMCVLLKTKVKVNFESSLLKIIYLRTWKILYNWKWKCEWNHIPF